MDRDQLAYIPELFDIHVMVFADESAVAVRALQDIFRIERDEARQLIADAPVVVKRAATPEVAEVLLDALSLIGAQVVLMPARQREPARAAAPAAAPAAPAHAAAAPAAARATGAGWGALDLAEQTRARRAAPETWDQSGSIPAALAGGDDLDYLDPPRVDPPRADPPRADPPRAEPPRAEPPRTAASLLELDVPTSGSNDRLRAVLASAERSRARAPAAELSLPPGRRESLQPGPPSLARSASVDGFDHAPLTNSLAPASLRPKASLAPAPPPPPAPARAMPPPSPPAAAPRKAAALPPPPPRPAQVATSPARKPGVPPPPPPPDLGLGTVPPLPLLAGAAGSEAPAPAPARKTRSSPPPPPHAPPRFEHRIVDAGEAMKLPRIDVSTPLLRPSPSAEAAATAGAGRLSATAAAPDANSKPARAGREPSTRIATQGAQTAHGAQAAQEGAAEPSAEQVPAKPKVPPARGRALGEIAFGVLVFYVGLQMGNSVLHGNASLTWMLLHALGLYAVGSGVRGLWP